MPSLATQDAVKPQPADPQPEYVDIPGIPPGGSGRAGEPKGLKPKDKVGAAFGSYGWSGESVKLINKELEAMKFKVIDPGMKIQYVPDLEGLEACREFGRKIAQDLPPE